MCYRVLICSALLVMLGTTGTSFSQSGPGGPGQSISAPADDFGPGALVIGMLLLALVCLVLIGVGAVVAVVLLGILLLLLAVGIVSSSTVIGIANRRVSSGFKALFIQFGAFGGLIIGGVVAMAARSLLSLPVGLWTATAVGAFAGILLGVGVAVLFNMTWGAVANWIVRRNLVRRGQGR